MKHTISDNTRRLEASVRQTYLAAKIGVIIMLAAALLNAWLEQYEKTALFLVIAALIVSVDRSIKMAERWRKLADESLEMCGEMMAHVESITVRLREADALAQQLKDRYEDQGISR